MAQQLTLGDLLYKLGYENETAFISDLERGFDQAERGAAASGKKAGQGFFSNLKSTLNPASIRSSLSNMFSGAPARAGAEGAGAGRSFAAGVSGAVARVRAQLGSSFGGAEPQARAAGAKAGAAYTQGFRGVFSGAALGGFLGGIYAGLFVQATNAIGDFTRELRVRSNEIQTENIKISQVFAQTEGDIRGWAESVRRDLGLSTQQVTSLAAATQDLLVPMGFQRDRATELTKETLNVAAALSQWDTAQRSSAEIAAILTKAYLGEREQLKTLGISISEADVKARLAAAGQEKLTGQALQQAKALATLELITEKSSDAQEAFANSADSAGRRMNEARSRIAEARDELAQQFAPAAGEIAVTALTLLGNVLESVANLFEQTETNVDNTGAALQDLPVKGAGALNLFFKLQAAIGIVNASIDVIIYKFALMARAAAAGLQETIAEFQSFTTNKLPEPLKRLLGLEDIQFGGGGGGGGGRNEDGLNGLERELAEAQARLTQAFVDYDSAGARAIETAGNFSSGVRGAADSQASFASSTDGATDAVERQTAALKEARTVSDVFSDLAEDGALAEAKAAAFGNTLEAQMESLQTRARLLERALTEALELGATGAQINYLVERLQALQGEIDATSSAAQKAESIQDLFDGVAAGGARAEARAARFGNTLEAQADSLRARVSLLDGALDSALELGASEAQIEYIVTRLGQLEAELKGVLTQIQDTDSEIERLEARQAARRESRNRSQAELDGNPYHITPDDVAAVIEQREQLGEDEYTAYLESRRRAANRQASLEDDPYGIDPDDSEAIKARAAQLGREEFEAYQRSRAAVNRNQAAQEGDPYTITPEDIATVVEGGRARGEAEFEAYQRARAAANRNQSEQEGNPYTITQADIDALLDNALRFALGANVRLAEAQREFGQATRTEVIAAVEAQIAELEELGRTLPSTSENYLILADALDIARQKLEALNNEGKVGIPQPDVEASDNGYTQELQSLEAEIKDVALSFPKAIVSGIGSGDIGGALKQAMGGAVTFFTDKLIENILGPIAEELARVAAQKLAVSAAGNAASSAGSAGSTLAAGAAGGPAGIALATLALVGGSIISAISGSRSRVREQRELYGSGGSSAGGSSGGGAATINNTANVTVSVTTPGGITDPGTQNEVRALARSSARDLLRELGLIKGGSN